MRSPITVKWRRLLSLAAIAAGACMSAVCSGATVAPAGVSASKQSTEKLQVPVFEFHSGFWINLHHFLYQQARVRVPSGGKAPEGAPVSIEALNQNEKREWLAALDYYAGNLAQRDLLFNG